MCDNTGNVCENSFETSASSQRVQIKPNCSNIECKVFAAVTTFGKKGHVCLIYPWFSRSLLIGGVLWVMLTCQGVWFLTWATHHTRSPWERLLILHSPTSEIHKKNMLLGMKASVKCCKRKWMCRWLQGNRLHEPHHSNMQSLNAFQIKHPFIFYSSAFQVKNFVISFRANIRTKIHCICMFKI